MKILLIVDNISYNKKWGNILNFVKKWFIYYLNNEIINNNISYLKIVKTFPYTELILNNQEDNNNKINIKNIIKFLKCNINDITTDEITNIISNFDFIINK